MFYASPKQMKAAEGYSDSHGVSYKELMENAGAAAAEFICRFSHAHDLSDGVLILCGKGNNGGDGFALARNLSEAGLNVFAVLTSGDPATELSAYEYCELSSFGNVTVMSLNDNIDGVFKLFSSCALIVDAVYGTGFHGELPPELKACFLFASRCKKAILALDVPSGGNCLTGEAAEGTLKCDFTVTFGCEKIGMLSEPLKSLCGEIITADIGFTDDCFSSVSYIGERLEEGYVRELFPARAEDSYKNRFGHLLNIAGNRRMSGAAAMSTLSALRSGVGLCTLASTEEVINRISASLPEATLFPLSADKSGSVSAENIAPIIELCGRMSAVSIGCGLSVADETKAVVKAVIEEVNCPIILDADGINCILDCIDIIRSTKNKLIITPHLGELKRLYSAAFGENASADRFTMATEIAREYNVIVAAKGTPTFIAGDGRLFVCKAGNPGLSRGGSGDVLTGIIAAFAAQGLAPINAAAAGVYVHGRAADLTAERLSIMGMLPSDVINELPFVFKEWNR